MGFKAKALIVAGAFHSPLMKRAADRLAAALDQVHWQLPKVPVLSNVTGKPHEPDVASIKRRLVEQVTSAVRWEQCMRWAIGHGQASFLELEPAKVLGGLMRRIDPAVQVQKAQLAAV
jgi:[acyl-carrier-protein] S-malonyltransferase